MKNVISITEHRLMCPYCGHVWAYRLDFARYQCPNCNIIAHGIHPDDVPISIEDGLKKVKDN